MIQSRSLQRLVFISLLALSCSKETSFEGTVGQIADSEWQFEDSVRSFHGNIDTAFRQTLNNLQAAFFQGTSDDGNGTIIIAVARENLATGIYSNEEVFFEYYVDGALIYSLPDPASRDFQIEITRIDGDGFAGVFSGMAFDSVGNLMPIEDGRFSARFATSSPGQSTLTVWTPNLCNSTSPMIITVNGQTDTIVDEFLSQPTCAAEGAAVFRLAAGTYELQAICGTDTSTFEVQVAENACTILELNINPSEPADFFPLSADSYWIYANKSNSSNTNRKTSLAGTVDIAGKSYTRFVNDLGDSSFYRKAGAEYFQYGPFDYSGNIDLVPEAEYTFLKEDAPVGDSWETAEYDAMMSGVNVKLKLKFTVVSKTSDATGPTTIDMRKTLLLWNATTDWAEVANYRIIYRKGIGISEYSDERRNAEWNLIEYQIR